MSSTVKGTFTITAERQPPYDTAPGATLSRTTFRKEFTGPLSGTSEVEMLSAVTETKGSAGYVAIERVHATLEEKTGTFVLQHSGTMNRGVPTLTVTVVPDSGTGALAGLHGSMKIDIVEGKHYYTFEYAL